MYLARIETRNFRNLGNFGLTLGPGLTVIVGANNTGKTNILDAIRIVLSDSQGPRDIWARRSDLSHDEIGDPTSCMFEIHLTFKGLTDDDLAVLSECLTPQFGKNTAQIHFRYTLQQDAAGRERRKTTLWGGETEGGTLERETADNLHVCYLPALRDAVDDLRPGRSTRISRLMEKISDLQSKEYLVQQVEAAHTNIRGSSLITHAREIINSNLLGMTGPYLSQNADLALTPPSFSGITDAMRALVGKGKPFEMNENGLGYNNLLYAATVLGELRSNQDAKNPVFNLLLIEEPEAHLHPQMQTLLIDQLANHANSVAQVIVTSHSPSLASHVPPEKLVVLEDNPHPTLQPVEPGAVEGGTSGPSATGLSSCGLTESELDDLRRFLDVTRATLLFARGIILVEGMSEALLLPQLAQRISLQKGATGGGVRLADHGVTVINVGGLLFRPFARLYQKDHLCTRCALLTDADPPKDDNAEESDEAENMSNSARRLKELESGMLRVFVATRTLEYDLAAAGNAEIMAQAYSQLRPRKGKTIMQTLRGLSDNCEKAKAFFDGFDPKDKARFAQVLAGILEKGSSPFIVPKYIEDAIRYVVDE